MSKFNRKIMVRALIGVLLLLSVSTSALAAGISVAPASGCAGKQYSPKEMLGALGYNSSYSGNLISAKMVRQFQADNGLAATGWINAETYALIMAKFTALADGTCPQPNPEPKPEPDKTYTLKEMLEELGYHSNYPGNLINANAVKKIQSDNGLAATGWIDTTTYNLILAKFKAKLAEEEPTEPEPEPKPEPEPEPEPTPEPTPGLTADEQRMVDLVNGERAKAGLPALGVDMRLVQLARLKSRDMIDKKYFSHTSPTYGSPFDMMRQAGVTYRTAGENIAGNSSVDRAHTALMNSSGHRANILNRNFTHFGIGIVDGGSYGKMFTQMFIGI